MEHALNCLKGGYVTMRHNSVRNTTAELLKEIAHDVQIEPTLQELTGETFELKSVNKEEDARLDILARNFWSTETKAYFDVKVFNPIAKSYINQTLAATHSTNKKLKKRKQNQMKIRPGQPHFGCGLDLDLAKITTSTAAN